MNTVDQRLALALVSFLTARGDRIASDLGTLTLHAEGCEAKCIVARVESADGKVSAFAVEINVGRLS